MGKFRPHRKVYGKYYGLVRFAPKQVIVREITDESDALFAVVLSDPSRCPHCQSKKCIHNEVSPNLITIEPHHRYHYFILCRCFNKGELFLNEEAITKNMRGDLLCKRCGSKEFIPINKYKLELRVNKNDIPDAWLDLLGDALMKIQTYLKCKQCNFRALLIQVFDQNTPPAIAESTAISENIYFLSGSRIDEEIPPWAHNFYNVTILKAGTMAELRREIKVLI